MPIKVNTTNPVAKKYKSKAVENLEDSYVKKLLKKDRGNQFPITDDMIKAKRLGVLLHREHLGNLTKEQSNEIDQIAKQLFESIQQTKKVK